MGWTSSTYFGEGLPWSIGHQIASEYVTAIGMSPKQVGYTAWLHGTTMLKFLWSPIVELFGSLRNWLVGMQALMGIVVGILAIAAHRLATSDSSGAKDTTWIWVLLVGVGILSATHDIACDGYYMAALDKRDQARYSGTRVAAFRAAMLLGSSALVFLGGHVSWLWGFGTAAAILIVLAIVHRQLLPRVEAKKTRKEAELGARLAHVAGAYLTFLRQPQVVLVIAFLLTYKMADVLMFSMSKVLFARELGIPTDLRGVLNAFSMAASIGGAILGALWISKRSLSKTLFIITLLMALTEPLFVGLAALAPDLAISQPGTVGSLNGIEWSKAVPGLVAVTVVVVLEQICGGLATAAQMVFIMRRCDPNHRAAHYAFATAIYSIPQMIVGGYSGHFYERLGAVNYYWLVSALTLPAVVLSRHVPTE